jgi:type IX secretion system PorP/SprF family membrane protein
MIERMRNGKRMRKSKLACLFALFVFCSRSIAQDIHFSQFDQAMLWQNSAQVGAFNGQFRFAANQRNQWRSVTTPYQTFGFSAEAKEFNAKPWSFGLNAGSDVAGDSRFRTSQVHLHAAHTLYKPNDSLEIRGGGSFGITSRGFDPSALVYDSQWNGLSFDPNLANNEIYATTARVYPSIGLAVFIQKQENEFRWNAGYSLNNITRPRQSFMDNDAIVLDMRHAIQASARVSINQLYEVEVLSLFQIQGKMKELVFGPRVYYKLPSEKWENQRVFAGIHGRFRDAAWIEMGVEYNEWRVGMSYDLNTSTLRPASTGRGGLEFSIVYIVPPKLKHGTLKKVCVPYY